ncbi:MAG TPA: NAD(P)/FAD-dependent oxidoreductase [Stellaceae bacterium]|nr:NAD(P)/FAD-dependent oxidoreductase [Stellaceae bacterium]
MQNAPDNCDVAIIGAGPVGLFAVFECGMLDIGCQVFDALPAPGGQCAALYPEKPIYDIPGHPRIAAAALVERLVEQAAPFAPQFHLGHAVRRIEATAGGGFAIENIAGTRVAARAVIIAAGAGAFGPNRPPLAGIAEFERESVFYLVRRREDFRNRRIVIAGGGDSAVDWALSLAEVAERVSLVHRRAKFRAAPGSALRLQQLAEAGRIDLIVPYQLHALEGEGGRLSAVVVADLAGNTRRLPADCLLPFFGLATDLGPVAAWGLDIEHNQIRVDPATCTTSRPGIFAIGDVAAYPGKLKLILSGFAEAALAAHAAYPLVHSGRALHFEYSTTKGLPGG